MNKTIALATDFSIESLTLLRQALKKEESVKLNVLLIHGYRSSDSIMDLLFPEPEKEVKKLMSDSFCKALQIIRNSHESRIASLNIELVGSLTTAALRNWLEGKQVEEVFVPADYKMKPASDRSFDLVPMLKQTGVKLIELEWPNQDVHVKSGIADLLLFDTNQRN
jgi:hypothetical protein